jgi:hypothetical protein
VRAEPTVYSFSLYLPNDFPETLERLVVAQWRQLKWDALVLGGTGALLATDRHIEKHIGNAHYTFYQTTSGL